MHAPMKPLEAFGDFPPVLYRVFSEEKWARAFVDEGRMRFRLVQYFTDLEDPVRADAAEGRAYLQMPGDVFTAHLDSTGEIISVSSAPGYLNYQGEFLNPVYVYCFSHRPDGRVDLLPRKFGDYIVRVDDPRRLAQDATNWLTNEGVLRGLPVVECHAVRYDKGERSDAISDNMERTRLNYIQKPRSFSDEYEYRFAVIAPPRFEADHPVAEYHDVILGAPLRYATLL